MLTYKQKRVDTGYIATCVGSSKISAFSKNKGKPLEKVLKEVATLYAKKYPKSKTAMLLKNTKLKYKMVK